MEDFGIKKYIDFEWKKSRKKTFFFFLPWRNIKAFTDFVGIFAQFILYKIFFFRSKVSKFL